MFEDELAARYVHAVTNEISTWTEIENPISVDTIYFGGGTPSLLPARAIEEVLTSACRRFTIAENAEITIELNPGDGVASKGKKLKEFRDLGINRASFGAQTFDNAELKQLGRTHSANDIYSTLELLREAGFENINLDLIAGLPAQTMTGWMRNLAEALHLRPEHLSLYLLDVHEATPLADQITRGRRPAPDDDLAAEMYATMIEQVCASGYEHYEISNFCLPGFESRHNTKYWTGAPYYGFGNSAHSYDGARVRWANECDAAKYLEVMEKKESPIAERANLKDEEVRSESIFLGLRLMRGIDLREYRDRFGFDLRDAYAMDLSRLEEAGLIEIDRETDRDVLKLTRRGALLSNEVMSSFV